MTKEDKLQKKREKRALCKEQGICTMCGCRPAREGKTKCQECADRTYSLKLGEDGKYKPEIKEKYNKWAKINRLKVKTLINNLKLERGCVDCGYNGHHIALDFDHLPRYDKVKDIARMCANNSSLDKILEEISKCEVVCAGCHRIRTWEREGWN